MLKVHDRVGRPQALARLVPRDQFAGLLQQGLQDFDRSVRDLEPARSLAQLLELRSSSKGLKRTRSVDVCIGTMTSVSGKLSFGWLELESPSQLARLHRDRTSCDISLLAVTSV